MTMEAGRLSFGPRDVPDLGARVVDQRLGAGARVRRRIGLSAEREQRNEGGNGSHGADYNRAPEPYGQNVRGSPFAVRRSRFVVRRSGVRRGAARAVERDGELAAAQ